MPLRWNWSHVTPSRSHSFSLNFFRPQDKARTFPVSRRRKFCWWQRPTHHHDILFPNRPYYNAQCQMIPRRGHMIVYYHLRFSQPSDSRCRKCTTIDPSGKETDSKPNISSWIVWKPFQTRSARKQPRNSYLSRSFIFQRRSTFFS